MNKIRKVFQDHSPRPLLLEDRYAVVILLVQEGDKTYLVYEKRAEKLRNQPGEISFPGGAIEVGESPKEAAIRETMEELLIPRDRLEIIGEMNYLIRRDGTSIRAFVGQLKGVRVEDLAPCKDEVDYLFKVPLDYFLTQDPKVHYLSTRIEGEEGFPYEDIPKGRDYPWTMGREKIYFYYWEDQIIWGLTAKFTYAFVDLLKKAEDEKGQA